MFLLQMYPSCYSYWPECKFYWPWNIQLYIPLHDISPTPADGASHAKLECAGAVGLPVGSEEEEHGGEALKEQPPWLSANLQGDTRAHHHKY